MTKQTQGQRDHLAKTLLQKGQVLGTSYVADQKQTVADMSAKMNPVILIFVLLSGVLSFVVLYNLTNINVSERIRELSTIKVLGFTNREVTLYIVRENIILTGVGIVLGFGLGNLLTAFILHQAETENVVFPLTINWPWYFVAAALMFIFTGIVMLVTHRHLKRIDMIDALKSNE
ncbi:ABC transporter permease protein [Agrilactobacillus composti DSM 18527 = JCM 14202]|nr:ABC transporter permease protein [Agrilactobacillus composti DSM 18527 = JCM 14202]